MGVTSVDIWDKGGGVQKLGFLLSKTTCLPIHTSEKPLDGSGGGEAIWVQYRATELASNPWPTTSLRLLKRNSS